MYNTIIDYRAFLRCKNLKTVTFGKNLKTIGEDAFDECNSLKSIVIPEKVTKIDSHAFWNCPKLDTLIIKSKNIEAGEDPFDLSNIKKLYFCSDGDDWERIFIEEPFAKICYDCKFATIKTQPTSVKAAAGKKVKLTVAATGSGLKYQWQYLKNGKWVNIKKGANPTLTVKMSESAVRTWRCVVTDEYGTSAISDSVETNLG